MSGVDSDPNRRSGSKGTQTDPTVKENLTFKYLEACCEGVCPQKDCSGESIATTHPEGGGQKSEIGSTCPDQPITSLENPCGEFPPCASQTIGIKAKCQAFQDQRLTPGGDQARGQGGSSRTASHVSAAPSERPQGSQHSGVPSEHPPGSKHSGVPSQRPSQQPSAAPSRHSQQPGSQKGAGCTKQDCPSKRDDTQILVNDEPAASSTSMGGSKRGVPSATQSATSGQHPASPPGCPQIPCPSNDPNAEVNCSPTPCPGAQAGRSQGALSSGGVGMEPSSRNSSRHQPGASQTLMQPQIKSGTSMKSDCRKPSCPAVQKALQAAYGGSGEDDVCPFEKTGVCPGNKDALSAGGPSASPSQRGMGSQQRMGASTQPSQASAAPELVVQGSGTCVRPDCPASPARQVSPPVCSRPECPAGQGQSRQISQQNIPCSPTASCVTSQTQQQQLQPTGSRSIGPSPAASHSGMSASQSRMQSQQPSQHQLSQQPSCQLSCQLSQQPSQQPSRTPSQQPSRTPSQQPSCQLSCQPSQQPSQQPSLQPSQHPSQQPSQHASKQPSQQQMGQQQDDQQGWCQTKCPAEGGQQQQRRPDEGQRGIRCTGPNTCPRLNPTLAGPLSPLAQMYLDMSRAKHDWGEDPFKSYGERSSHKGYDLKSMDEKGRPPSREMEKSGRGSERPKTPTERNRITLSFAKNIHPVIDVSLMSSDGGGFDENEEPGVNIVGGDCCCSKHHCCNKC